MCLKRSANITLGATVSTGNSKIGVRGIVFLSDNAENSKKFVYLERDSNSHLRVPRPPLYPLNDGKYFRDDLTLILNLTLQNPFTINPVLPKPFIV